MEYKIRFIAYDKFLSLRSQGIRIFPTGPLEASQGIKNLPNRRSCRFRKATYSWLDLNIGNEDQEKSHSKDLEYYVLAIKNHDSLIRKAYRKMNDNKNS